jgi:thiamine-phosphate pyrophosphorylase
MKKVWRILDANLNRASEGLRVIEEIARFVMDDEALTAEIKQCRHRLAAVCQHPAFNYSVLIDARDAQEDVGGGHTYSHSEGLRADYREIAIANIKRVQEAARALEEFGKLVNPAVGHGFKQFRFMVYTMEKTFSGAFCLRQQLVPDWGLYVITGDQWSRGRTLSDIVSQAIAGGASAIQLREKGMDTGQLVEAARCIRKITQEAGAALIINDRVDVALAVDADGVHIGQHDMNIADVRKVIGIHKLVGVSTHNVIEAKLAEEAGADYIGVGPIFATATKEDIETPKGIQMLQEIRDAVSIPCIAIGGIKPENVAQVISAGADGVAVITAVVAADNVKQAAAEMLQIINAAKEYGGNRELGTGGRGPRGKGFIF